MAATSESRPALVSQQLQGIGLFVRNVVVEETVVVFGAMAHVFEVEQLGFSHLVQQSLVVGQGEPHVGSDFGLVGPRPS